MRGIVVKTFGIAGPLRQALKPLAARLTLACIFGSVAKGTDAAASDVDLLVVSDTCRCLSARAATHAPGRVESDGADRAAGRDDQAARTRTISLRDTGRGIGSPASRSESRCSAIASRISSAPRDGSPRPQRSRAGPGPTRPASRAWPSEPVTICDRSRASVAP